MKAWSRLHSWVLLRDENLHNHLKGKDSCYTPLVKGMLDMGILETCPKIYRPHSPSKYSDFIIHYIASFYLHAFPTWLIYTSVNSLDYSIKCIPNDSPSSPHDQCLAQVSCGAQPEVKYARQLPMHVCDTSQTSYFYPTDFLLQALIVITIERDKNRFHSEGKQWRKILQHLCNLVAVFSAISCRRRKPFYFKKKPVLLIQPRLHMPWDPYILADWSAHRHKLYVPRGLARISFNDTGRQDRAFIKPSLQLVFS